MSDRIKCRCQSCTIQSLMGPAIITAIGVLFLLNSLVGGYMSFGHTWPIILVVIGLIKLASALAPKEGHIGDAPVSAPPAAPPPVPPAAPYQGQGQ